MGCVTESCNKGAFTFYTETESNANKLNEDNLNYSFMKEPQYDQMSKEFFNILNEMRISPEKYIEESKDHNLFEIFIKLKPCPEINLYQNDLNKLKRYLMKSYVKNKSINEQEKEIKNLINENISEIYLFQLISFNNNIKENVWDFLSNNEDDIEKIFDTKYKNVIIIGIPLEHNIKILFNLIFYKE